MESEPIGGLFDGSEFVIGCDCSSSCGGDSVGAVVYLGSGSVQNIVQSRRTEVMESPDNVETDHQYGKITERDCKTPCFSVWGLPFVVVVVVGRRRGRW